jgi:hypothetical protein
LANSPLGRRSGGAGKATPTPASLTVAKLSEPGEPIAFASRDEAQAEVAVALGFKRI